MKSNAIGIRACGPIMARPRVAEIGSLLHPKYKDGHAMINLNLDIRAASRQNDCAIARFRRSACGPRRGTGGLFYQCRKISRCSKNLKVLKVPPMLLTLIPPTSSTEKHKELLGYAQMDIADRAVAPTRSGRGPPPLLALQARGSLDMFRQIGRNRQWQASPSAISMTM